MNTAAAKIRDNLLRVQDRVQQAAAAANRDPQSIRLVGITKYVDVDLARILIDAGCRNIGESRPQVLEEKRLTLARNDVTWHLVGHLQRNKVSRTLKVADLIHSVDSIRLAETISRMAAGNQQTVDILLEVNISGDTAKHGFQSKELTASIDGLATLPNLQIRGLMGMAGLTADDRAIQKQFASLRQLRDQLRERLPAAEFFNELSMGMSGDFEQAIAEGATLLRIGSVLFEGVL